jgi:long-subunit fatty acid transport protein
MRRTSTALGLVLALLAGLAPTLLAPAPAAAQSKTGTAIAEFLAIEPSARLGAMGNAGVAVADGIEGVWFNPGVIGALDHSAVMFTHAVWFADISYDYAAGAFPIGRLGNVFAGVTALNSGDIDVRTVDQPLGTGERYDVANTALALGFGRQITSRFAAALQFNYVHERIWHSTLSTMTASAGTVYRLTDAGGRLGFSLANIGTRAQYGGRDLALLYDANPDEHGDNSTLPGEQATDDFPVPILFRLGVSWPVRFSDNSELLLVADALHPSDNPECLNLGVEWTVQKILALRAGYQTLFESDSQLGFTFGAGVKLAKGRLRLGYGWADHKYLEGTHRISVVVGL